MKSFKEFLKESLLEESTVKISDLQLNPDGEAIAKGYFNWGGSYQGDKDKPIAVVKLSSGKFYVLDGYHRLTMAKRAGKETIDVREVPMSDDIKKRLQDEKVYEI